MAKRIRALVGHPLQRIVKECILERWVPGGSLWAGAGLRFYKGRPSTEVAEDVR